MNEKRSCLTRFITVSVIALTLSTCLVAIAQHGSNVGLPDLREELLERADEDQAARKAAIAWVAKHGVDGILDEDVLTEEEKATHASLWAEVATIDAENTAWLKSVINNHAWMTYADVGRDGAAAAWLIVQHATADPSFQRLCLDLMKALPKDQVSQQDLALLTDRVLLAEGRPQIYGSQFVVRDGKWLPINLEDEENVDARRAEVGLPPMHEYRELLEAVQRGEVEID